MKTRIAAWSLGMLSLSMLAGCGWERPFLRPRCRCSVNAPIATQPATRAPRSTVARTHPVDAWDEPAETFKSSPTPTSTSTFEEPAVNRAVQEVPKRPSGPGVPSIAEVERLLPIPESDRQLAARSAEYEKPAAPSAPRTPPPPAPVSEKSTAAHQVDLLEALNKLANQSGQVAPLQSNGIRHGPSDNYHQLTGQLQQWRNTWRLRYAAVGAEDRYGGSVVLDGVTDESKLRDGRQVRVRGRLVPAETRQGSPRYVVQSLEVLD